jgi:hypothetical protein
MTMAILLWCFCSAITPESIFSAISAASYAELNGFKVLSKHAPATSFAT